MRSFSIRLRPSRLAAILALLAVVAQLWISQVIGAEHLARLLSGGAPSSDICSAQNSPREGGSTNAGHSGHPGNALGCAALCSASTSESVALPEVRARAPFAQAEAVPPRPELQFDGRRLAALRPPAQAPPTA